MKNGLISENGKLIYYQDDVPVHAGVVLIDGDLYYIGTGGIAATGRHTVHSAMANGLLKHGYYTFGDDGKLIKGSYVALKRSKHRRRRKSSLLHKIKRSFSKSTKKRILITVCTLLLAGGLVLAGLIMDDRLFHRDADDEPLTEYGSVLLPAFENEVVLTTPGALACYRGEMSVWEARVDGDPYLPMTFSYNLRGRDGVLYYGESSDFSDAVEVPMSSRKTSLQIDNLKTGTTYYFKVVVEDETHTGTFKTAASTRFIAVEGLYNARDIGGYVTLDGKTVRQGMIIRGTEIDGLVEQSYQLSHEALDYMASTFQFVYEMDLRAAANFTGTYTSYLGQNVRHAFYTAPQYDGIFDEAYKENLKRIFSDLAKPENYPMYMHCTYGADRTGTVIFLLQAVLNMSKEQMICEYQRTGFFSSGFATSDKYDLIIAGLASKAGNTLQEKIVHFLIDDIGVTQQELDSIRDILLMDTVSQSYHTLTSVAVHFDAALPLTNGYVYKKKL